MPFGFKWKAIVFLGEESKLNDELKIKSANKIVVLDKGQITEQGTHAELMARGGIYKKLVDLQTFDWCLLMPF